MSLLNRLNPMYIYKRRSNIIPFLKWGSFGGIRNLLFFIASKGYPIIENDRRLAALKNKHKGQRCFVIGNGPSLLIEDLDHLKKEVTLASNKIYLAFEYTDWRPTYYVAEDKILLDNYRQEIDKFTGTVKLFPWRVKLWIPPVVDSLYFNLVWEKFYPNEPKFGTNPLYGLYWGSTVTYTLIQLACYMGIREIYLLGVDFDYTVPKNHEQGDKPFVVIESRNHFHPNYFKPGDETHPPNLQRHKKSYEAAKKILSNLGGEIYNATRGGKLEIFQRVNFDSLLEDC